MSLLVIVLLSAAWLTLAYFTYGPVLSRLLRLRADVPTPAVTLRDDVDFAPIEAKFLLGQHFSAIAAAGPIIGPILAGVAFGWLPALLWILLGSVFIGGVHDMTSLVASIRHKARSIAEVVRDHISRRSYVLFLMFVWIALIYIIVAFTDVTAQFFHGSVALEDGQVVLGGGIATSSLLYLLLPVVMGVVLRYTRLSLEWATVIFLPLVALSIWVGQKLPLDVESVLHLSGAGAQQFWNVALLLYCVVASVLPMWVLLQPRGHLGGYFLYFALAAGVLGVLFAGGKIEYPAVKGSLAGDTAAPALVPLLFITIACGACSGFHSIIASGTTSKQLKAEPDARSVGYGAMLLEAMVAVVSLSCLMVLKSDSPLVMGKPSPNLIYAQGIGAFLTEISGFVTAGYARIPRDLAVSFGLMAFTTFVYDTLDVCTRLGRYILQELTGAQGAVGRWVATIITAGVPLIFLLWSPKTADNKPAWLLYWNLFGASNQLLAALTLLGVTIWLWRTYRAPWVFVVTGLPCAFMYIMSMWALIDILRPLAHAARQALGGDRASFLAASANPIPWVSMVLAGLGILLLIEAVRALLSGWPRPPAPGPEGLPVPV